MKVPNFMKIKLSQQDCIEIKNKIAECESTTSGEVVPMIVSGSSTTGHILPLLMLLLTFLDFFSGLWELSFNYGINSTFILASLHFFLIFVIGRFLAHFNFFKRTLTSLADQNYQVQQRALNEFYNLRVHHTQAKTGVLIFVSLLERMAIVVGDEEINQKIKQEDWDRCLNSLVTHLKRNKIKQGFISCLDEVKKLLSSHFPLQVGDVNELANDLIIKE